MFGGDQHTQTINQKNGNFYLSFLIPVFSIMIFVCLQTAFFLSSLTPSLKLQQIPSISLQQRINREGSFPFLFSFQCLFESFKKMKEKKKKRICKKFAVTRILWLRLKASVGDPFLIHEFQLTLAHSMTKQQQG